MSLSLLPLAAPAALLVPAFLALAMPGRRPRGLLIIAEVAALAALGVAIASLALLIGQVRRRARCWARGSSGSACGLMRCQRAC